ncbi:MAG: aldo/keto reductase [Planctomycetota bacterium]|jgi:predicted aldo/keto reductase-like oxidoreductase
MIYKAYGKTGLNVSAVGFGGMQFDTKQSNAENAGLVQYAVDQGINYLDTAPGYCDDQSEDIFGLAIKNMGEARDDVYISTKAMPEKFDTAQKAIDQVDVSLKRLNVDSIDFYHVWCIRTIEQYELAMKPGGQYEGLLKCKAQGKIRHIVVSTHLRGPEVTEIIEKKEFDGVLLGANILNFLYRWQGVQAAYEMGLGVVAMNPLGGGIIPQNQDRFSFLAADGETPTEAALRFCISCPQYTVTLNGFTTRAHIDTACKVADNATPFTEEDRARISRHVTQNMDKLCTGCGYCMDRCPRDIPISNFMQYYNQYLLNSKTEDQWAQSLGEERIWGILADRKADAGDCVRCGRCEMACTQHLDIMARLDKLAEWETTLNNKEQ